MKIYIAVVLRDKTLCGRHVARYGGCTQSIILQENFLITWNLYLELKAKIG